MQCTKGPPGKCYKDSEEVKAKFWRARATKQANHWKEALQARRQARMKWEQGRLEAAAAGDWTAVRKSRSRQDKWETGFAESTQGHPHEAIHEHVERTYAGDDLPLWEDKQEEPIPNFTMAELRGAALKGATGKAVGVDGVSHEMLQAICNDEVASHHLLDWFNGILQSGVQPQSWCEIVMVVLPKIRFPVEAKHIPECFWRDANRDLGNQEGDNALVKGVSRQIIFIPSTS